MRYAAPAVLKCCAEIRLEVDLLIGHSHGSLVVNSLASLFKRLGQECSVIFLDPRTTGESAVVLTNVHSLYQRSECVIPTVQAFRRSFFLCAICCSTPSLQGGIQGGRETVPRGYKNRTENCRLE